MQLVADTGFIEIADRVWVSRHSWFDMNVTVVAGARGLVVLDTLPSAKAATDCIDDLRRRIGGDVVAIVNSHEHFDHVLGNATFRAQWPTAQLIAHEIAAARTLPATEEIWEVYRSHPEEPRAEEVLATQPLAAEQRFSSVRLVDLGDRSVELIHPGRGHTAGDLVMWVPDAGVLAAGDLVEESPDRCGTPGFGPESHTLEWPGTLDVVLALLPSQVAVVPGHGSIVGREYVEEQRDKLAVVAETIRGLAATGVPPEAALGAAEWPYPAELLGEAVRTGYRDLPPGARSLPLVNGN